jgi:CRISPR-associated protein Csb1
VTRILCDAYDRRVEERALRAAPTWETAKRDAFLEVLRRERVTTLLEEPADKKAADAYAERGFVHVPASATHGGVIATGGIRRDATLQLGALRLLAAGKDEQRTLALRRYILGLALTALTYTPSGYLRQGCNLVPDPEKKRDFEIAGADGKRQEATLKHGDALAYAKAAAQAFGVGKGREVKFDNELAKRDLAGAAANGAKRKKGGKTKGA